MKIRNLLIVALVGAALVGCSGQDVGDANKNPPPGAVTRPTGPAGAAGGGVPGGSPSPTAPGTPK